MFLISLDVRLLLPLSIIFQRPNRTRKAAWHWPLSTSYTLICKLLRVSHTKTIILHMHSNFPYKFNYLGIGPIQLFISFYWGALYDSVNHCGTVSAVEMTSRRVDVDQLTPVDDVTRNEMPPPYLYVSKQKIVLIWANLDSFVSPIHFSQTKRLKGCSIRSASYIYLPTYERGLWLKQHTSYLSLKSKSLQ